MNYVNDEEIQKQFEIIDSRLAKIEDAVFDQKTERKSPKKYDGVKGGINFLIDNGFFEKLVSVKEIKEELKKEGYIYSIEIVDRSIRREFHKKKILAREKEGKVWKYTLRK